MSVAYTNATIWTGTGEVIEGGTIVVDGATIAAVGVDVATSGADVVDLSGMIVVPGFIDCHSHAGLFGEGSSNDHDGNEMSEAITAHVRTLDAIHPDDMSFGDARRGGVTTMGVSHGSGNIIGGQVAVTKTAGTVADDMVIKEPAGVKMALGENPKRVGNERKRAPMSRMGTAYLARRAFTEAIEYRKDWQHHEALLAIENAKPDGERKPLREPKRDLSKEILVKVLEGEVPVRNHSHRMDDIRTAIRLSEEFGYRLVIDHGTESWKIPDEIVSRGIPVAIGPIMTSRSKRELINRTPAAPGLMVAAGATVAIMTDAPVNPINNLRDMVIMCIREGLPQDRALETVTMNPASILGVADRLGSLEPGKDADFLVFDGDPWDARNRVKQTYIDGALVHEDSGPYIP